MTARFDDSIADRSLVFGTPESTASTTELSFVTDVVRWAERAASEGRWVALMLSYEAAPAFDAALTVKNPTPEFPLAWAAAWGSPADDAQATGEYSFGEPHLPDEARWSRLVERVRERIAAGDTYQVNLTTRIETPFSGVPEELYRDLHAAQRGAFSAYLEIGERWRIASASPELFFTWSDGRIVARPMKGTAPRGRWLAEDVELREQLAASIKDRAENLMIVDMVRNDLGRVAVVGSVAVDELFTIEAYPTVWQMTSTVSAETAPGTRLFDVLEAIFPCASVTGAPKASTMRIIAELEDTPRDIYCGALCLLSPGGSTVTASVPIRTAVVDVDAGVLRYGVGGGIVWDSIPAAEWRELSAKSQILRAPRGPGGLIETLRWDDGWWELDAHLDRMEWSAQRWGIPWDRPAAEREADRAITGATSPLRVRLSLAADGSLSAQVGPLPGQPTRPWRVAVDHVPVDPDHPLLFHKVADRSLYDAARKRHPEADDVLLVNTRGEITESTIANVLVRRDGDLVTPPLASGCLPGIRRQWLIETGTVREAVVAAAELPPGTEVTLTNSVRFEIPAVVVASGVG